MYPISMNLLEICSWYLIMQRIHDGIEVQSELYFTKVDENAVIPTLGSALAAGYDLYANHDAVIIGGSGNVLVKTGVRVHLPSETYGRIAMRSGLAYKHHLCVSAGVIDEDYTGEIGVLIFSSCVSSTYEIKKGDRIAQLVVEKIYREKYEKAGSEPKIDLNQNLTECARGNLAECARGECGYGSSGR